MDVLLVEDDKAIATIITDYLKKENLYVTWCEDGETGLQKLKEHAYKVAIIDLMLPKKRWIFFMQRSTNIFKYTDYCCQCKANRCRQNTKFRNWR